MNADPYRYFRLEAREILDQCGAAVLALEKSGDIGEVQRLLRLAHTLKGAARIVKQPAIADGAHAIEDVLEPFRDGARAVSRDSIDAVLRQLDAITGRVMALDAPGQAGPGSSEQVRQTVPRPAAVEEPARTVRTEIAEMDALVDGLAETHALLNGLRETLRSTEQVRRLADLVAEQLTPRGAVSAPLPAVNAAGPAFGLADDLRRGIGGVERQLGAAIDQIDRELRQLRDAAEQLRLVGAGTLITVLERTARDAAQAVSKTVAFEARGGDIRLAADVLAIVQGAMVQIVRNAVAHGIEDERGRRAAGKPPTGRISLEISRRGGRVVFTCRDDGRGLDLDEVRRAALRRGMTADAAARLGAQDLIRLLLRGGISTSGTVTEIAGRGVGLDVVRTASERLGGTVEVATEPGRGSVFELAVPLSLMSIEALIVEAAGIAAALPIDAVRTTLLIGADAVSHEATGAAVLHEREAVPFVWLPRIFDGPPLPRDGKWPTIIIAAPGGLAAVGVERLLGTARSVVRPLPALAPAGPIVAGALLDAEGRPQLLLSAEGLVAAARRQSAAETAPEPDRHPVLVIDDSLTTRMLEQSILESAGYEVDLAVSAEEALEIAGRKRYALFLVDVEMPGMDGFTFVERVRADPVLRDIPAVLVTSRASPDDLRRGRDAGARGHIAKGEFDQNELLATIRSLIG
jgi:two-component system chemotaxis sensor kinase CheA